jgi:hypothetical protein
MVRGKRAERRLLLVLNSSVCSRLVVDGLASATECAPCCDCRLQSAASGPTGASAQKELATAAVAEGGAAAQETLSAGLEALEVVGNGEQQQQQQQQEDQQ